MLNRSVPANLLEPATVAGKYTVQLETDWSDLENALAALEAKMAAWIADRSAAPPKDVQSALIDKALVARKTAEGLFKEIDAAKGKRKPQVGRGSLRRCDS